MDTEVPTKRDDRFKNLLVALKGLKEARCRVVRYEICHGHLGVVVYPPGLGDQGRFYLHFAMVDYFEGPMSWTGADFRLGTSDEAREVLHKTPFSWVPNEYQDELLGENLFLFVLEKPNLQVKILACRCDKVSQVPLYNFQDERFNFQGEYYRHLRSWGTEVWEAAKDSLDMCKLSAPNILPEMTKINAHQELLVRLSALVKRGRWLFPNVNINEWDEERKPSFNGYNQELLSAVANIYRYAKQINPVDGNLNQTVKEELKKHEEVFREKMSMYCSLDVVSASSEYFRIMKRR